MKKSTWLDAEEQDLEDNLEKCLKLPQENQLKILLEEAAKTHLSMKKPITIRASIHDLEIIKLKASKIGVPYQTYINMLIHKDASNF